MTNVNIYKPTESANVFSSVGRQIYKSFNRGDFYYYSPLFIEDSIVDKSKVDDVWLNGSYYIIQNNMVYKKNNSGDIIAWIELSNPRCLSARQFKVPLPLNVDGLSVGDSGCWIIDIADRKIILCDSDLKIIREMTNVDNPVFIISTYDDGAYYFDDTLQRIFKINENCDILGYLDYGQINIQSFHNIQKVDIDIGGNLWYLIDTKLIRINYDEEGFNVGVDVDIGSVISIYLENNPFLISDFVIEKSTERNIVYVCGCVESYGVYYDIWISKFDLLGQVIQVMNYNTLRHNMSGVYGCPILLSVSQWGASEAIYLVFEDDEDNFYFQSSSSSSSDFISDYNYYINILQIDAPRSYPNAGQGPAIPCPRVNSWAEGEDASVYYVRAQSILTSQNGLSKLSGVDIFFWNERSVEFFPQSLLLEYTGNPKVIVSEAGERKDQTKYQIQYDKPGDYVITIRIKNK